MTENEFVPLAPRRVGAQASLPPLDVGGQASLAPLDGGGQASLAPPDGGGRASLAPPNAGGQASLAPLDGGGQASLAPLDVGGQASLAPPDVGGQASLAPPDGGGRASLAPLAAEPRRSPEPDDTRIRAAAIELAAAACARALRYAIDRNPRLLARFVDDALRAAGSPRQAVVRIAPALTIAGADSRAYDLVADPALSLGDVFIDCDAGTLGATIGERAERLVRAVAS